MQAAIITAIAIAMEGGDVARHLDFVAADGNAGDAIQEQPADDRQRHQSQPPCRR